MIVEDLRSSMCHSIVSFRLLFTMMKSAVVCVLIAHVLVMTSSQPTYDLEQLQINYDCQLVDEKLDILARSLKRQVAGMQNEIQQLREEVRQNDRDMATAPGSSSVPTS